MNNLPTLPNVIFSTRFFQEMTKINKPTSILLNLSMNVKYIFNCAYR